MADILQIAVSLIVPHILNVLVIIAYPGPWYVMENMTVQMQKTNILFVEIDRVQTCLNAKDRLAAFTSNQFVMA